MNPSTSPPPASTQPQAFRDSAGRTWSLQLSVSSCRRVLALTSIDLMAVYTDPKTLERISAPPYIDLCNVLYALCKPQADAAGVNDEQFGEGLGGESLRAAILALREALVSFPENPEVRAAFRKLIKAQEEVERRLGQAMNARISEGRLDEAVAQIERQAIEALDDKLRTLTSTSGSSSTASPAS